MKLRCTMGPRASFAAAVGDGCRLMLVTVPPEAH